MQSSSSSSSSLVKGYYFSFPSLTYCIDNHTVVNLAILLLQEIATRKKKKNWNGERERTLGFKILNNERLKKMLNLRWQIEEEIFRPQVVSNQFRKLHTPSCLSPAKKPTPQTKQNKTKLEMFFGHKRNIPSSRFAKKRSVIDFGNLIFFVDLQCGYFTLLCLQKCKRYLSWRKNFVLNPGESAQSSRSIVFVVTEGLVQKDSQNQVQNVAESSYFREKVGGVRKVHTTLLLNYEYLLEKEKSLTFPALFVSHSLPKIKVLAFSQPWVVVAETKSLSFPALFVSLLALSLSLSHKSRSFLFLNHEYATSWRNKNPWVF